jgi:hypothetical protein
MLTGCRGKVGVYPEQIAQGGWAGQAQLSTGPIIYHCQRGWGGSGGWGNCCTIPAQLLTDSWQHWAVTSRQPRCCWGTVCYLLKAAQGKNKTCLCVFSTSSPWCGVELFAQADFRACQWHIVRALGDMWLRMPPWVTSLSCLPRTWLLYTRLILIWPNRHMQGRK